MADEIVHKDDLEKSKKERILNYAFLAGAVCITFFFALGAYYAVTRYHSISYTTIFVVLAILVIVITVIMLYRKKVKKGGQDEKKS